MFSNSSGVLYEVAKMMDVLYKYIVTLGYGCSHILFPVGRGVTIIEKWTITRLKNHLLIHSLK